MASAPRRRWSRELPPDLSDLMNKLIEYAASFIKGFDHRESEMRRIVREFKKISDAVRKMQERTDAVRAAAAVTGATGGVFALGLLAAPFTGGLSLAAAAAVTAGGAAGAARAGEAGGAAAVTVFALGLLAAPITGGASLAAAAAAGGAVTVVATNIRKRIIENGSAKEVEELGKQFMETVEPLKKILEEIKTMCEKLEQQKTEAQAENTLTDMEEFQRILRRVSDLREKSGEVLDVTVTVMERIGDLVRLVIKVFSVSATPEEDRKLIDSIIQSADQCQRVTDHFDQMKTELKVFRETK